MMTLLSLLKAAFDRVQQGASNHLAYQQLRELDPHLLNDIGLRLEAGRVVVASEAPERKADTAVNDHRDIAPQRTDFKGEVGGAGG